MKPVTFAKLEAVEATVVMRRELKSTEGAVAE
jgi:hypothetical protein